MSENKLGLELIRLLKQSPLDNTEYFQFSLFSNGEGEYRYSYMSHWCGHDENKVNIELRAPSVVIVDNAIKLFREIDEPLLIINDKKDLFFFLNFFGGNGLIEKKLSEEYLKSKIQNRKVVRTYDQGYLDFNNIPKKEFNRAANPKLRMKIFKRDNFKCKTCGASPANNEHVELHLHHITPLSCGGLTRENNLITLCHTCHKGLEPHYDLSLYSFIGIDMLSELIPTENYRERIKRNISFGLKRHQERLKDRPLK